MATARHRLLVSFTVEELETVKGLADQVRLPISELLRRLVLGLRLPDPGQFVAALAIRDLLKVNADQARLGNLLKLALEVGDTDFSLAMIAGIEDLMARIGATQAEIKETVAAIHYQAHPRASRPGR